MRFYCLIIVCPREIKEVSEQWLRKENRICVVQPDDEVINDRKRIPASYQVHIFPPLHRVCVYFAIVQPENKQ